MTPFTPDMPPTNVSVTGDLFADPEPDPEDPEDPEDPDDPEDEQAAAARSSSPPTAILFRCVVLIDCYLPFC
jgi:hypothetical protein